MKSLESQLNEAYSELTTLKKILRENLPLIFQYLETKRGIQDIGDPSRYMCGRAYKEIATAIGFDYELEKQQKENTCQASQNAQQSQSISPTESSGES